MGMRSVRRRQGEQGRDYRAFVRCGAMLDKRDSHENARSTSRFRKHINFFIYGAPETALASPVSFERRHVLFHRTRSPSRSSSRTRAEAHSRMRLRSWESRVRSQELSICAARQVGTQFAQSLAERPLVTFSDDDTPKKDGQQSFNNVGRRPRKAGRNNFRSKSYHVGCCSRNKNKKKMSAVNVKEITSTEMSEEAVIEKKIKRNTRERIPLRVRLHDANERHLQRKSIDGHSQMNGLATVSELISKGTPKKRSPAASVGHHRLLSGRTHLLQTNEAVGN